MTGLQSLNEDLSELIGLFQSHHVEFLVVGAHAMALHARPRFTEDLDLFVQRTEENAHRIRMALQVFGFELTDEAEHRLGMDPRAMIVLGRKPNQVDILNFLDGVEFGPALARSQLGILGDLQVPFIGLVDFIATKRASGRPKDIDDLGRLKEQLGSDYPEQIDPTSENE